MYTYTYMFMHTVCLQIRSYRRLTVGVSYLLSRLHKNSESARQVKIQPQTVVRTHI